jgi:hypothetical protein
MHERGLFAVAARQKLHASRNLLTPTRFHIRVGRTPKQASWRAAEQAARGELARVLFISNEELVMYRGRWAYVALCALTLGFGDGALVASAAPDEVIKGGAKGQWDLPTGPKDTGYAAGGLFVANTSKPILLLKAELTQESKPGTAHRFGKVKGVLFEPDGTKPAYLVAGIWQGPGSAKEGQFEAKILDPETHEQVGKMNGKYVDPEPFKQGGDGQFKGLFALKVN